MRKAANTIGPTMYLAKAVILLLCIAFSCAAQTRTPYTAPASQVETIAAIGRDIAKLKTNFPQLREFSVSRNVLSKQLTITYEYHTHEPQRVVDGAVVVGWTAEVPNPDDDGVWFYIDFHDPASTDPIHTRPGWAGRPPDCFEDKRVSFLILEGEKTRSVSGEISEILRRYGVEVCTPPARQIKIITAIGQDIAKLKAQFPQLREFSVSKNVRSEELIIDYAYHTHRSQIRGGWRAQVPEPDDDGVWFYIDFHDPHFGSLIDTQPADPQDCFEDKKVQFLILEGDKIKRVSGAIQEILRRYGVKPWPCGEKPGDESGGASETPERRLFVEVVH